MMEKIKRALWVHSPEGVARFLATYNAEQKFDSLYTTLPELNMEDHGWVRVGEAEIIPTYTLSDTMIEKAIESADNQIEKLTAEFHVKIQSLKDFKATLLALPAPEQPAQGDLL